MEQQHLDQFSPKKKWYVYFIDFIMLFVAVTLGFLAENVRDQQTDKNREISYLKNVHEDLLVDLNRFELCYVRQQLAAAYVGFTTHGD